MSKKGNFRCAFDRAFALDPAVVSILRVGFALCWLIMLIWKSMLFSEFFAGELFSLDEARSLFPFSWKCFPILWFRSVLWQSAFLLGSFVTAICIAAGWNLRIVGPLAWFFCINVMVRTELTICGMDMYVSYFLLLISFLPGSQEYPPEVLKSGPSYRANYVTFTFVISVCLLYFTAGIYKDGSSWKDGSALSIALSYKQLSNDWGRWLLNFPTTLRLLTYLSKWGEVCFPIAILIPTKTRIFRRAAIFSLMAMHVGIFFTLKHGMLPVLCVLLLGFLLGRSDFARILTRKEAMPWPAEPEILSDWKLTTRAMGWALFSAFMLVVTVGRIVAGGQPVLPTKLDELRYGLRFHDYWGFYEGNPFIDDGWWLVSGSGEGGRSISPFPELRSDASETRPPSCPDCQFSNPYWRAFSISIRHFGDNRFFGSFARYLCLRNPGLVHLSIKYIESPIGGTATWNRTLFDGECGNLEQGVHLW